MTNFIADHAGSADPCGIPDNPVLAPELSGHFQDILNQVSDTSNLPDPEPFKKKLDTFIRHMLYSPTDLADIFTAVSFIHNRRPARHAAQRPAFRHF